MDTNIQLVTSLEQRAAKRAAKFVQKMKDYINDAPIRKEIISEIISENDRRINPKLDQRTLEYILLVSGEPGMDMGLLRSVIQKHIQLKTNKP